jgi:anti-anti-sigma regulatory factor
MHDTFTIQLAVERSRRGVVVHAAGELSGRTSARLLRLLDDLVRGSRRPAGRRAPGADPLLVVDLAQIRSFDPAGIDALRRARDHGRLAGVGLYLTGLSGRQALLPGDVAGMLSAFAILPTVEQALGTLPTEALAAASA